LVGKNYSGYGRYQNENFVKLLENFKNTSAPASPLVGQLWYDSTLNAIKVYNGTGFKLPPAASSSGSAPSNKNVGDLWYDSTNQQLNLYDGSNWKVIGPSFSNLLGTTGDVIDTISDGVSNHTVIKKFLAGNLIAIISKDAQFTPSPAVAGFSTIRPGYNISSNYDLSALNDFYVGGDANITGTLTVTGAITGTISKATNIAGGATGSIPVQTGANTTTLLPIGTNGYVLTSNGTTVTWSAASAATSSTVTDTTSTNATFYPTFVAATTGAEPVRVDSSTLTYNPSTNTLTVANLSGLATKATNVAGGAAGSIVYQSATDTTAMLPIGTAGRVLQSTGTTIDWAPVGMPAGAVIPYAGTTLPAGWLWCDNAAYDGTNPTYAALWASIGTTYGGTGITNFRTPDMRGRVAAGWDGGAGRLGGGSTGGVTGSATLGAVGGEQSHSMTGTELTSHSHGVNDPSHAHGISSASGLTGTNSGLGGVGGGASLWSAAGAATGTDGAYTGISIQNAGGGAPFNVVQPTIVLYYIIKI
jgi:microcystin-dependent protein